jgi:hypothetical protein
MDSTEAMEDICLYITQFAMFVISLNIVNKGLSIEHFFTIPALCLGWTNALAVKAISETLGIYTTNGAIFGNNTCICNEF